MCTCMIVNLMPEASLEQQPQNQEVAEVLKSVRRYNLLFLGGARGFIQMLLSIIYRATPLDFIPTDHFGVGKLIIIFKTGLDWLIGLGIGWANALWYVYASQMYKLVFFFSRFAGGIGIGRVFDCSAIILILILRLVGIYRRRRLMQRVRRLAAMELLQE
ncbi:hypothetical protein Golob_020631 [Gossypium lobatum]|uniref:Uncharacterized protein n=1 Tax=Gossypium lobatum TaxID=34289 RepID=A0A7J8LAX5_9ROSI|nr:hypothetical protein [Gossypium lobatum]